MTTNTIAETPDSAENKQEEDSNAPMTVERAAELIAEREAIRNGKKPEVEIPSPEEDEEKEVEEEGEEEIEEGEEAEEEESEEESVLSKFDISSLTDSEKAELAKELGSGAGKTIGKQRKQIRELEAKLKSAEEATKKAVALAPASENPYSSLHKSEDVASEMDQAKTNVDFWDAKLDQAIEDEVYEIEYNGQTVTTKAIRAFVKEQRQKLQQLEKRQSEIKKVNDLFDTEDEKIETLRLELGMEEDSKASKAYEEYLTDPSFQIIKNIAPEFALKLIDALAYAAVAKNRGEEKPKPKKRKAPKAQGGNSIPRGGAGESSNQSQLSAFKKIVYDTTKSPAERKAAAIQIRQLQRKIR